MGISESIKQLIGTTYEVPAYPNDLPIIDEYDDREGILIYDSNHCKVTWKENGLLHTILFRNGNVVSYGSFRLIDNNLKKVGEWLEFDKYETIHSIEYFSFYGERVFKIFESNNIIYSYIYSLDNKIESFEEKFIPLHKRKKYIHE